MTNEPASVDLLVAVVTDTGSSGYTSATVQRSQRFPSHIFSQIENMAQMGDVPVALIINRRIECGLDAVKQKLPQEVVDQISTMLMGQITRPSVTDSVNLEPKKSSEEAA